MTDAELFIRMINREAEAGAPHRVADIAREAWPVLRRHVKRLHPEARAAVEAMTASS